MILNILLIIIGEKLINKILDIWSLTRQTLIDTCIARINDIFLKK